MMAARVRWRSALSVKLNMARNVYGVTLFLLSILEAICGLVEAVEEHRQAFIQTDSQLRHLVDGISLHMHQGLAMAESDLSVLSSSEDDNTVGYSSPVTFYPSELNFKEHPVGIPDVATVIVSNPSLHSNVYLLSISGSTVHFHCSFFQDKVIAPGGNTTFSVVFLSRQEGHVHNTLYIHTSSGSYKYQVHGVGTPNPYRLRPFVGAKVPLNSVYSSLINMYNPHSSALQVIEMYSSGGDLHLELPTGEREANQEMWEIPPYGTKSVVKANFMARIEDNHTMYIRIKTNSSLEDYLVLPVEVEVTSAPGIYTTTDALEFGVMYYKDAPRTLALHLLNRGPKPVLITSVIAIPSNDALRIDFQPVRVPADTEQPVQVATITFHPSRATNLSNFSGKIVIRSKNGQLKVTVPYLATVLHGTLEYNSSDTEFYVGDTKKGNFVKRNLSLTNTFNVSVAIYRIELPTEAMPFFEVEQFKSVVLHPNQTRVVGVVKLVNYTSCTTLNTYCRIFTNVSEFRVPLLCYDGKLSMFMSSSMGSASRMDLGTLSLREKRDVIFGVVNDNPVSVQIHSFGSTLLHNVVEFLGVQSGNISESIFSYEASGLLKKLLIPPSHFAMFRFGVSAPKEEENFDGELFVETQYEVLKVPVSFRTAEGALSVAQSNVMFESAFPGKVASVHLYLQSTFSKPMAITSVITLPHDARFSYRPPTNFLPILQPNARTLVGKLLFDFKNNCLEECYTGINLESPGGAQWASSFSLPCDVSLIDIELYEMLHFRWKNVSDATQKRINVTFQIDTSEVRGFQVHGQALLSWPNLSNKQKLSFPLTQIGNTSVKDIALVNPSSAPVIAQIIPLHCYPNPEAIFNTMEPSGMINLMDSTASKTVFRLKDPASFMARAPFGLKDFHPHPETIVVRLEPGSTIRLSVEFVPDDEFGQSSVLLIRNNLTVLETVTLQGSGAYGQLRFGNRLPGSKSPLQFELGEKHLQDCDYSHSLPYALPNFTVRRAFTVRNTGLLPIYVDGFDINGSPCEGYGFRVLTCQGFHLSPNASRKVDIAFTPDFTMSWIQRQLNVHTSLTSEGKTLNYSLVATLPPYLISRCTAALPRPLWEPMLYYIAVCLMGFLFFCVVVTAYLESDRIYRCAFVPMTLSALPSSENSMAAREIGKVFDLKTISATISGKLPPTDVQPMTLDTRKTAKKKSDDDAPPCSMFFEGASCSKLNLLKPHAGRQTPRGIERAARTLDSTKDVDSRKTSKKQGGKKIQPSKDSSLSSGQKSTFIGSAKSCSGVSVSTVSSSEKVSQKNSANHAPSGVEAVKHTHHSKRRHSSEMSWSEKTVDVDKVKPCHKNSSPVVVAAACGHASTTQALHAKQSAKPMTTKETSSSTDDSSSSSSAGDVERSERGKNFLSNRVHPKDEWHVVRNSKSVTKSREVDVVDDCGGDDQDEGEFEVTIRNRSKKPRGENARSAARLENLPLSLELPYKPKGAKSSAEQCGLELAGTGAKGFALAKARHEKKALLSLALQKAQTDLDSRAQEKVSPQPDWDQPTGTFNSADVYNMIARQTETFAMKAMKRSQTACDHKDFPPSANNKPMSSRAGIPPLSSSDGGRSCKVTPVGKIAPEPKRIDPKDLGPVGKRPAYFKSLPLTPVSCWNSPPNAGVASPVAGTPLTPPDHQSNLFLSSLLDNGGLGPNRLGSFVPSASTLNDPVSGSYSSAPIGFERPWRASELHSAMDNRKQMPRAGNNWLDFGLSNPARTESVWNVGGGGSNSVGSSGPVPKETVGNVLGSNPWGEHGSKESPWPSSFSWSPCNVSRTATAPPVTVPVVNSRFEDHLDVVKNIWNSPSPGKKDMSSNNWVNTWMFGMAPENHD